MVFTHQFCPSALGDRDIRGFIGETLTDRDAYAVGRASASLALERGGRALVVGSDGRDWSSAYADIVAAGVRDAGLEACLVGNGPAPMLYYACHALGADGGIYVAGTDGHPAQGAFKIDVGHVRLRGGWIRHLGLRAASGEIASGDGRVTRYGIAPRYIDRLGKGIRLRRERICVWEPATRATADIVGQLVRRLPGRHIVLDGGRDGDRPTTVAERRDPATLRRLRHNVTCRGAEIGFAFDGGAGRLSVVDADGRVVLPDHILVLLARRVLDRLPGRPIVADPGASRVFSAQVARAGGTPSIRKPSDPPIDTQMRRLKAPLAGETGGQIYFTDRWYGFEDAVYAALRTLEALDETDTELADFVDSLPDTVCTPEIRIACAEQHKQDVIASILERLRQSGATFNDVDGIRYQCGEGWWMLRASESEPALVARIEAVDPAALTRLKHGLSGYLALVRVDPQGLLAQPAS